MRRLVVILSALFVIGCADHATTSQRALPKRVTIATLMTHPALQDVRDGISEELKSLGYHLGSDLVVTDKNANGQIQLASSIARAASQDKPDAFVAITTPMAQAAASAGIRPLVFAAVTDPVGAKLVGSLTEPTLDITGTSDAWPYAAQLRLIREVLPRAKTLGVLFNPGESASQYGMANIRRLAPSMGFTLIESPVANASDVYQSAAAVVDKCDALFLSSDNTVIAGSPAAIKVAQSHRKALFAGDSGTVAKGALASVSVGYRSLGRATAILLDKILRGQRSIPVTVCQGDEVYVNSSAARKMDIQMPAAILKHAKEIY